MSIERNKEVIDLFHKLRSNRVEIDSRVRNIENELKDINNLRNDDVVTIRKLGDLVVPVESTYEFVDERTIYFSFDRGLFHRIEFGTVPLPENSEIVQDAVLKQLKGIRSMRKVGIPDSTTISLEYRFPAKVDRKNHQRMICAEAQKRISAILEDAGYLKPSFKIAASK